MLTCSPEVADEHGPTRRNLLVGGGYLCRREGIERKGAGNDLTLEEALPPEERADLAGRCGPGRARLREVAEG